MRDSLVDQAREEYAELEEKVGEEGLRQLERRVVLAVLDRKWREHLYEMDYLKDGIGLRGMGQRDPLVEYQREGYQMYNSLMRLRLRRNPTRRSPSPSPPRNPPQARPPRRSPARLRSAMPKARCPPTSARRTRS